jgi:DNA modification methylase
MIELRVGDCREVLKTLPAQSVQCCITSPPYFGLRDYGVTGQVGMEPSPEEYVQALVGVFREVWRVLRDDGTLWLNLGDTYAANRGYQVPDNKHIDVGNHMPMSVPVGLKPKDLIGTPWRTALALQADGWYLRSDIVWAKPNPMPESVTDRPTRAHEYLFLLTKQENYFYDAEAVREPSAESSVARSKYNGTASKPNPKNLAAAAAGIVCGPKSMAKAYGQGRNLRSVWFIPTKPFKGAHFAVFPPKLVEPCLLAGTRPGNRVLDPFCGSGTVGVVARQQGRAFLGIDLNPEYVKLAQQRIDTEWLKPLEPEVRAALVAEKLEAACPEAAPQINEWLAGIMQQVSK